MPDFRKKNGCLGTSGMNPFETSTKDGSWRISRKVGDWILPYRYPRQGLGRGKRTREAKKSLRVLQCSKQPTVKGKLRSPPAPPYPLVQGSERGQTAFEDEHACFFPTSVLFCNITSRLCPIFLCSDCRFSNAFIRPLLLRLVMESARCRAVYVEPAPTTHLLLFFHCTAVRPPAITDMMRCHGCRASRPDTALASLWM